MRKILVILELIFSLGVLGASSVLAFFTIQYSIGDSERGLLNIFLLIMIVSACFCVVNLGRLFKHITYK